MKRQEKRLREIVGQLPEAQAQSLLEFAEFLLARYRVSESIPREPLDIPRPGSESVVRAIKRLRETYPMLNPASLLNETSILMSQHVIRGRDAIEVIDELEILFRRHYDEHRTKD